MGQVPNTPVEETNLPVVQQQAPSTQTFEQTRVADAKARADNAVHRARQADSRIQALRNSIIAEGEQVGLSETISAASRPSRSSGPSGGIARPCGAARCSITTATMSVW